MGTLNGWVWVGVLGLGAWGCSGSVQADAATPSGEDAKPQQQAAGEKQPLAAGADEKPAPLALATDNETNETAAAPSAQSHVELAATPQFSTVLVGRAGEINLLLDLKAEKIEGLDRGPVDLAIVLDRSGSMSGDKILAVKEAALQVSQHLRASDRISLFSYSDDVVLHVDSLVSHPRAVPSFRDAVLGLHAGGGTALGPALFQSLDRLTGSRPDSQSGSTLSHVMLLSDGLANQGESNPDVIAARAGRAFTSGTSVSTLGVGADYNEDLMTKVADHGGGRYHFIENSNEVSGVLMNEFAALVGTVASGVELAVNFPSLGAVSVVGYESSQAGTTTVSRIGALGSGQSRQVLVKVQHPPLRGDTVDLGEITLRYRDTTEDGRFSTVTVRPSVKLTTDPTQVTASENPRVSVRLAELAAARQLQIASAETDQGRFDQAKVVLQSARVQLEKQAKKTPSPALSAQINELKEAEKGIEGAKKSRSARKLYQKRVKSSAYDSFKK